MGLVAALATEQARHHIGLQGSYHSAVSDSVTGLRCGRFSVTPSRSVNACWRVRGKRVFGFFSDGLGARLNIRQQNPKTDPHIMILQCVMVSGSDLPCTIWIR